MKKLLCVLLAGCWVTGLPAGAIDLSLSAGMAYPGVWPQFRGEVYRHTVISPLGRVSAEVDVHPGGQLTIQVQRGWETVLQRSPIGITVDGVELGDDVKLEVLNRYAVRERYDTRGRASRARHHADGLRLKVWHYPYDEYWVLDVRAYDTGIAWRYQIPGEGTHRVVGEVTAFDFPRKTVFWAQDDPHTFEAEWRRWRLDQHKDQKTEFGLPVTAELPDGRFVMIAEADVLRYSGMSLRLDEGGLLQSRFIHDPQGWTMEGPFTSPWRVVLAADHLDQLVQSRVIHHLAPEPDRHLFPEAMRTGWLEPGTCYRPEWVHGREGARWNRQKALVDEASSLGCGSFRVGAGWEDPEFGWGRGDRRWERLRELVEYAGNRDIGVWISVSTEEDRRSRLESADERKAFFDRCGKAMVEGVTFNGLSGESQDTLALSMQLLREAAARELMVSFRDTGKAAGQMRTWPNEMTREAIRGLDHNRNEGYALPASQYCVYPFTRLIAGPADFSPMTLRPDRMGDTTAGLQFASAVIFSSPVHAWADSTDVYRESLAFDMMRAMPVSWDETRAIAGSEIGRVAAFARRKGEEWWVAVMNGTDEAFEYSLGTFFLKDGHWQATILHEAEDDPHKLARAVTEVRALHDPLLIKVHAHGGFVARFVRK
ncbi:glycoside hydrolase family 97 protein [Kiritimatiella glycovorans]|uniref:Alpha-glucosidase, family GH97 n=1 Tax=Kiritimatiella glycovorans TaxID=1307763 RepID=A0A0G3EIB3_9BACT|nr:glycoside hydrolase family 97 protein [Kiritimatiella glycovorans]AKJ63874.1 Alpha-glucosidase, family GH97 [Kiritimatiella glycovorans]